MRQWAEEVLEDDPWEALVLDLSHFNPDVVRGFDRLTLTEIVRYEHVRMAQSDAALIYPKP